MTSKIDDALSVERQNEDRRDNCKASLREHSWKLFGLGMTIAGVLIWCTYSFASDTAKELSDSKKEIAKQFTAIAVEQKGMSTQIDQIYKNVVPPSQQVPKQGP